MNIASVKRLLKSNGIEATNEQVTAKMQELGITSLDEKTITIVVDSFVSGKLATSHPKSKGEISNAKRLDDAKNLKSGIGAKIQADINAFEQPLIDFSEQVSSNEAMRIYESHIASLPVKVAEKTGQLIQNHTGDTKSLSDVGFAFANALSADFYSNTNE